MSSISQLLKVSSLSWLVHPERVRVTMQTRAHWTELDEYVRKMPSESDFGSLVVEKNKNKNRNFQIRNF